GQVNERNMADISWHGCQLFQPGWNDANSRALAFTVAGFGDEADIHVMLNMFWQDLDFELPPVPRRAWYKAVDTALEFPLDIEAPDQETLVSTNHLPVGSRSLVVLLSK